MTIRNLVLYLAAVTIIGMILVLGVAIPSARAEDDNHECSNASLQGSYGFRLQGTIFAEGLNGGVGVITFDGNGNWANTGTFVNQTRGVSRASGIGTYTVNSDCTGTIPGLQDFVIVDGGDEIFQTATRGDRVVIWVFKKQFPRHKDGQGN